MTTHDFNRNIYDNCVYFKKYGDGSFVCLFLYVDDMLLATKDKGELWKMKAHLSEEFKIKNLGAVNKILGMET